MTATIAKRPEPRVTCALGRGALSPLGRQGIPFFFKLVNLLKAHGSRQRTPSDHGP